MNSGEDEVEVEDCFNQGACGVEIGASMAMILKFPVGVCEKFCTFSLGVFGILFLNKVLNFRLLNGVSVDYISLQ